MAEIEKICDPAYTAANAAGHAPILEDALSAADDHLVNLIVQYAKEHGTRAARNAFMNTPGVTPHNLYFGGCSRTCAVCIEEIRDVEKSTEFGVEGVDQDVFTKSSLGVPQGPMYSEIGAPWTSHGGAAGVPMGSGLGGRVPKYGISVDDEMGEQPFDDVDLKAHAGCGPGCDPTTSSSAGLDNYGAGVMRDFVQQLVRGDLSAIPEHDYEACEFSFCMEPACRSYRENGSMRFRASRWVFNKLLDFADKRATKNALFAGVAAGRRMMQGGASTADLIDFVRQAKSAMALDATDDVDKYQSVIDDIKAQQARARTGCFPSSASSVHEVDYLEPFDPFHYPRLTPRPSFSPPGWPYSAFDTSPTEFPTEYNLDRFYVGIFR